jgi:DNA-binding LacI/PurR family transcriptional regulator
MTPAGTKVMIAAPTFAAAFQAEVSKQFKKLFKPEEVLLRAVTGDADVQRDRLHSALAKDRPTALITISVRPDRKTVPAYTSAKVPVILIDEEADGASTIATDNFLAGRLVGEYLVSHGRKKIGIVSGRTGIDGGYNAEQRIKGFREALVAAGLYLSPECVVEVAEYSSEEGVQVMPRLLDGGVDAIFCAAGDNCAVGLLTVAKQRGLRVPEDIAIVGFDDLLVARVSTPRLTTIRQPVEQMVEAAYKMAVTQRDEILRKPQKAIFRPELVVRQSA